MAERKIKQWITVNGVHVPLYEGESKDDAVKRSIKQAQENRKKDDDQKEKDIARNQSEKDKLNKANSLVDEQNRIMEKYGPKSKEYEDFKKKKDEFLGKKGSKDTDSNKEEKRYKDWPVIYSLKDDDEDADRHEIKLDINSLADARDQLREKYGDNLGSTTIAKNFSDYDVEELNKFSASLKEKNFSSKGSLSDTSSGKASDEARVNKNKVPASFAANYPNLSSTQLKQKYEEYLKKNRK